MYSMHQISGMDKIATEQEEEEEETSVVATTTYSDVILHRRSMQQHTWRHRCVVTN